MFPLPETFRGENVTIKVDVNNKISLDEICGGWADDDWPTPTDEQLEKMYTMSRGVLEGMTREEFDQLREERIMGIR